jgi:hypothetical protein
LYFLCRTLVIQLFLMIMKLTDVSYLMNIPDSHSSVGPQLSSPLALLDVIAVGTE